MRFTVDYPIGTAGCSRGFLSPEAVTRYAAAAEAAGIDAIGFTEHPAPSKKWLDNGGHESLDPLTALAFCAATTRTLRLMTFLLVLPYRNPLLLAKQIATADVLSGGRLIVATGTGYLRSEFAALGVAFEERNDLYDEAIDVLRHVWTDELFAREGRHFHALGQASRPAPVQLPHPPIWIGGNSRRARERVAAYGQGWAPMIVDRAVSESTRTAAIDSLPALRSAIAELRTLAEDAGRNPADIDIQVQWRAASTLEADSQQCLSLIEELATAGVTWLVLNPPADDVERSLDALIAYGERVIRPLRASR